MKRSLNLCGAWEMRRADEGTWYPAIVPGSVYADLITQGRMDDPFYRDNEPAAQCLMNYDWVYRKSFHCDTQLFAADQVLLSFEGLDTLAKIVLNKKMIGHTRNMHRSYEFDVKDLLKPGENELEITFSSPNRFMAEVEGKDKVFGSQDCTQGYQFLRKAHYMSGWDWGPRLPDCGIWRSVSLVAVDKARIDSVLIRQDHRDGHVNLSFSPETRVVAPGNYVVSYSITAPDGQDLTVQGDTAMIEQPALWWPRGYGEQKLYTVCATLSENGRVLDTWIQKIGLRQMELMREPDDDGEIFAFRCNGLPLFLMGADYIPEDNILARVTPERSEKLLSDCALANYNALRIWGGGYYLDDSFYDTCDELGLVIWHDFMFACASYMLTPAFDENVRAEVADNVRRLRHHPSIGLWCGNNEMEEQVMDCNSAQNRADYIKIFEYIIPSVTARLDPDRAYWPSSPSSGGSFDDPRANNRGDVHDWSVWHGELPFPAYRKRKYRFVSEFGFQSFPCKKTVESFTLPEDRNIFSYVMEKHQRNNAANGKIMNYMGQTFLYPTSFDTLLYASQLLQMEAVRYGVEHWRRQRGYCMGTIYWQANDCWPVASWSSIDYFGRWKALHYAAKRFFAPVLLSCSEESTLTQEPNINAQDREIDKSVRLNVCNETRQDRVVTVHYALRKNTGEALETFEETLTAPALKSTWLEKRDFPQADMHSEYVSYSLCRDGQEISHGSVLFDAPKHFKFLNPHLTVTCAGDTLTVASDCYARSVEITCEDGDVLLSDNYFDLDCGIRTVRILRGEGTCFTVRSVYDIR